METQLNRLAPLQGCNLNPACRRGQDDLYKVQCQPVIWNHTHLNKDSDFLLHQANTLSFCGFNITHLETGSFSCRHHLILLHLSHNKIKQLDDGVFDGMTSLRQIWLNNNLIHTIGNNVFPPSLNSLQVIDLSYNKLTAIDTWPYILPGLILLNMSNNLLGHFENSIGFSLSEDHHEHSDNITIDILNNKFTFVNFGIEDDRFPEHLFMEMHKKRKVCALYHKNPIDCNCSMFRTYDTIIDFTEITLYDNAIFRCSSPEALEGIALRDVKKEQLICDLSDRKNHCPTHCHCVYIPAKGYIQVNCTAAHFTTLPDNLPRYFDPRFSYLDQSEISLNINFTGNNITSLQNRNYLSRTSILDLRDNRLETVEETVILNVQSTVEIHLQNNLLTSLPGIWEDQQWTNLKKLSLNGNPFVCDCSINWLPRWIQEYEDSNGVRDNISCIKNEDLVNLSDWESTLDCKISIPTEAVIVLIVIFIFGCIIIFAIVRYKNSNLLRNEKKKMIEDTEKMYDAFVCFADDDVDYIHDTILPLLEPSYKLLLHYRDFPLGSPIIQSIVHGIENSQKILFVVSNAFLESEWCMFELERSVVNKAELPNGRIIIILKDDIEDRDLNQTLRILLNTVTYLKWNDDQFAKRLEASMPSKCVKTERHNSTRL